MPVFTKKSTVEEHILEKLKQKGLSSRIMKGLEIFLD